MSNVEEGEKQETEPQAASYEPLLEERVLIMN